MEVLIVWILINFLKISDKLFVVYRSWNIIFAHFILVLATIRGAVE